MTVYHNVLSGADLHPNANLTGVITSVGNATSIASQTGTGTKFVVDTSPTLVTPTIASLIGNKIYPSADSTTAIQLNKADGTTNVLNVDTTNERVGIGTTSPTSALDVRGSSYVVNIGTTRKFRIHPDFGGSGEIRASAFMQTGAGDMVFAAQPAAGNSTMIAYYNQTAWYSGLEIANTASGYGNLLLMKSGGNVGIGTTNPATKLDIAGSMQVSSAVALSLGGYVRTFAEATGTPSGTTTFFDIAVAVPIGCKLLGAQLRVDTALTTGETWGAAYVTGSTTTLAAAGTAVAKNTKVNKMHVDEITTATTNVRVTRDAGNFTNAAGVIRAIVYYETLTAMGTAA